MRKKSKGIEENKQKVTIKSLIWEFNLYCKFMCADKIMITIKRTYSLPSSIPVIFFLIAEKSVTVKF